MISLAREATLLMSSLSIYRGILNRTVPKAFFMLLCSLDKEPIEFAGAWENFSKFLVIEVSPAICGLYNRNRSL